MLISYEKFSEGCYWQHDLLLSLFVYLTTWLSISFFDFQNFRPSTIGSWKMGLPPHIQIRFTIYFYCVVLTLEYAAECIIYMLAKQCINQKVVKAVLFGRNNEGVVPQRTRLGAFVLLHELVCSHWRFFAFRNVSPSYLCLKGPHEFYCTLDDKNMVCSHSRSRKTLFASAEV